MYKSPKDLGDHLLIARKIFRNIIKENEKPLIGRRERVRKKVVKNAQKRLDAIALLLRYMYPTRENTEL